MITDRISSFQFSQQSLVVGIHPVVDRSTVRTASQWSTVRERDRPVAMLPLKREMKNNENSLWGKRWRQWRKQQGCTVGTRNFRRSENAILTACSADPSLSPEEPRPRPPALPPSPSQSMPFGLLFVDTTGAFRILSLAWCQDPCFTLSMGAVEVADLKSCDRGGLSADLSSPTTPGSRRCRGEFCYRK